MSNNSESANAVINALEWRYAVKSFDPDKKVPEDKFAVLEQSLILSPSSYGLQPYKFIVVTDSAVRAKLRPACFNQPQISDCSHLVVFAAKTEVGDELVEEYAALAQITRKTEREQLEGYISMMKGAVQRIADSGNSTAWSQRQAYLALGILLESSALIGVDACPMEGFDPTKVDEILGLEGYTSSVLCAVGYRSSEDKLAGAKKIRFAKDKLIERV